MDRPIIVCLCGSTRFSEAFREANLRETLAGKIVLSIGADFKSDDALGLTAEDKHRLDALHLRKIELADEVLFLNVGGYLGRSSLIEYFYAANIGKEIRLLEPPKLPSHYYIEASKIGLLWLKEQRKQGKFTDGMRLINRRAWFSDDM